uniref:LTO1 maturation factor of ABCE1 n=1 Tax=Nomascus leucogenys TaxID=61853 RepID=G1RHJ4_NOMLE
MAGSQDIFDAIVMADERFHGEGYREGYEEGSSLGVMEGRQHGTLHGAKIGSEIGCYQGFAFAWKCLLHSCTTEKDSRKMKVLESLIGMIQKFPYDDPTYDKLHEDLDKIRGKFKQMGLSPSATFMFVFLSSAGNMPVTCWCWEAPRCNQKRTDPAARRPDPQTCPSQDRFRCAPCTCHQPLASRYTQHPGLVPLPHHDRQSVPQGPRVVQTDAAARTVEQQTM